MLRHVSAGLVLAALTAIPAFGQDSVGKGCLPGDAVSPWDDAAAALGSEQCNAFVNDLTVFETSKGHRFGITPLLKSSKTSAGFFSSLVSAQGISRIQAVDVECDGPFSFWAAPGFGVNNDVNNNDPGAPASPAGNVNRFGVLFSEFATTDNGANYAGVIGGIVCVDPNDPLRLYTERIVAATNSCDDNSNLAAIGVGSIDESGNVHVRSDEFGGAAAACGYAIDTGSNIYRIELANRDCDSLNVISNTPASGDATTTLIDGNATAHSVPNIIPTSIGGTPPVYMGANFNGEYVRGNESLGIANTTAHYGTGVTNHRGTVAYSPENCAALASTHGIAAVLGVTASGTTAMNVFGLGANGAVTGAQALNLPAVVTDNLTGFRSDALGAGQNSFDHYHSQTAFQGGNAQVALGVDQNGDLLAAAEVDFPTDGGASWPLNYIGVARVDCATGDVEWTMAGYCDGTIGAGGTGKPICDETGATIGRMVTLDNVTGGTPFGPSVSAPMIDSVGNVWFQSAVEIFGPKGSNFAIGLLRGIYDPATFSYTLELVFRTGYIFHGRNSDRDYLITFMGIADSDSVSSGAAWSQNISAVGHLSQNTDEFDPSDPRTLGGLVVSVGMIYDANNDGDFTSCVPGPGPQDQEYNVLLYLGATSCRDFLCGDANCDGAVDAEDIDPFFLAGGNPADWQAMFPGCNLLCAADINDSGGVDAEDIDPFFVAVGLGFCP